MLQQAWGVTVSYAHAKKRSLTPRVGVGTPGGGFDGKVNGAVEPAKEGEGTLAAASAFYLRPSQRAGSGGVPTWPAATAPVVVTPLQRCQVLPTKALVDWKPDAPQRPCWGGQTSIDTSVRCGDHPTGAVSCIIARHNRRAHRDVDLAAGQ